MNYPQKIKSFSEWFLDLIFPEQCIYCAKFGHYVCKKCLKDLPINKGFLCIGCARPVDLGKTCFNCSKNSDVDYLWVASDYKDPKIEKLLKLYKYRFIKDISQSIWDLFYLYLTKLEKRKNFAFLTNPLVMFVPITKYRLNWRGFNQTELLARKISLELGFELDSGSLVKLDASSQADLGKNERIRNIKGKIGFVGNNLKGRQILLIDDVCSTGATLSECARNLKENGASKVLALVVARG